MENEQPTRVHPYSIELNLHHPSWDPAEVTQELKAKLWFARKQGDVIGEFNINQLLGSASFMKSNVKEIPPRPLTEQESGWIREILQTHAEWKSVDINETQVVAKERCDEGISILLQAPGPQNPATSKTSGYIGRVVICTTDSSVIEVRLTQSDGRLQELFVLFVDPKHPRRVLPESWTEASHEVVSM